MSTSHEQESHGSKRRSSFETTPPHKKSRIDLLFSNDDAIEPNLAFWNNTEASDEEEVEEEHQPFQRSLHSALLLSSNIDEHERRKSLLLLPEDDEDVDQDELTTLPISKIQADFDDEVDAFFSSRNNDPAEFVMSSSLKMSLLQQQNSLTGGYPAFFTTFPHFLNTEYFESHLPSDRMIPQQQVEESKSTGYFDATFQILGHLDSGEYSDVWKARDDQDNICAIKKLKVSFMSWDHRWEQITEVEHLLKLQNSKHCVQLLNAWEQEGYLYLQMELCTAGSLEQYIKLHDRRISHDVIWDMMYEMLLGVKDIHDHGLVHLDLKPSNLLIDNNGFLKIADFGVSVQLPTDHRWVRGEGDRRYMAPDLLREQFDKPADIFSLGMILLELATGIILPGEGESWESLRLGDFSEMEESLSVLPKEMSNMIIWLLTAESTLRPNIDAVLESDQFSKRQVSDKGTLYEYYVQQQEEEQEEEQDIGASAMLFEQNQQDNDDDKCIAGQAIHSTPEAKVY